MVRTRSVCGDDSGPRAQALFNDLGQGAKEGQKTVLSLAFHVLGPYFTLHRHISCSFCSFPDREARQPAGHFLRKVLLPCTLLIFLLLSLHTQGHPGQLAGSSAQECGLSGLHCA